jgi:hypothetical protein
MSAKYDSFKAELIALCEKHGVQLATSGYDKIQVWNLEAGDSPIYGDDLEDKIE